MKEEKINQEELRKQFKEYLKTHGVKARFVAQQIGNLDESVLSRFKNNIRDLWEDTARDLKEYLDKFN